MDKVVLEQIKISKLTFLNEIEVKDHLDIQIKVDNVIDGISDDKKKCKAHIEAFLEGDYDGNESSKLEIGVVVEGFFKSYETDFEENNDLKMHITASLFPYLRTYIATITAMAGMNALNIPDFSDQAALRENKE